MDTMAGTVMTEPAPPLTAHDRCDRCGAQARVRVMKEASELVFCLHHTNRMEAGLVAAGWSIVTDQRDELMEPKKSVYI